MSADHEPPAGPSWIALPSHRSWLEREWDRLVDFAERSAHPDGGFGWLDSEGKLRVDVPQPLWLTARMTHIFALAGLLGRPGAGPLSDVGIAALSGRLHDDEHGGWFAQMGGNGAVDTSKQAYAHSFVVLAAASATAAGRPGARELLDDALNVVEARFWDDDAGLVVDVWDRSWTNLEPYRGINANMHTVEAFLAAADVTRRGEWRQRALRIAKRVLDEWARGNDWRIPEHFDPEWQPMLNYNAEEPGHPFRPFGATVGHALEWSRLVLHLRAALDDPPEWTMETSRALFERAVADGWSVDGAEGFVYTTDWEGRPVVRDRMHWVLCEGVAAAAALLDATGEPAYEAWYRRWWDCAAEHFIDRERGSWIHQLDATNRPASSVWEGKPDVYHAAQATLLPRLPLAPTLAAALRDGLLT